MKIIKRGLDKIGRKNERKIVVLQYIYWAKIFAVSVSYGETEVTTKAIGAGSSHTTDGDAIAISYTMGSMKIAGNMNEVSDNDGVAGSNDSMTEIAVSFAF